MALQPPQSRPLRLFDNSITSSRLFAWYPITICVIALAVYVFLVVDDGFPAPPGPGGGGEGIFFQIVWLWRLLTVAAIFVCLFTAPRKLNMKPAAALAVIIGWSVLFAAAGLVQYLSMRFDADGPAPAPDEARNVARDARG